MTQAITQAEAAAPRRTRVAGDKLSQPPKRASTRLTARRPADTAKPITEVIR
jgi:hypothetical protein